MKTDPLSLDEMIRRIKRGIISNPYEAAFLARYKKHAKKAVILQNEAKQKGLSYPKFIIASITGRCNLRCVGCYARENSFCDDVEMPKALSSDQWKRIFDEAKSTGTSFILLAGGEPLLRKDVLEAACATPEILFPVFTNGTLMDDEYIGYFKRNRNLKPVISIEGDRTDTDLKRGTGIYDKVLDTMLKLRAAKVVFGASITVTLNNLDLISSDEYIQMLRLHGCMMIFFVEYVPADQKSDDIVLGHEGREFFKKRINILRDKYDDIIFISLPGDELEHGGCLAAGRSFFHVDPEGNAQACPFSSFSDTNVRDSSLFEAIDSPLFSMIRKSGMLDHAPKGGCVLFEERKRIEKYLNDRR